MHDVTVDKLPIANFEALQHAVQGTELDVMQLGPGPMQGSMAHFSLGNSLGLSTGSYSNGMRARGIMSKNREALVMMLQASALIQHYEMSAGDILRIAPNQEFYASHAVGNRYAVAFVDPADRAAFLNSQQPGAADIDASLLTGDRASAQIRIKKMNRLLDEMIAKAEIAKAEGSTIPAGDGHYYIRSVMALMYAPVLRFAANKYRGPHLRSAVDLVRKAEDYVAMSGPRRVHLSEVCEVLRVAEQTLRRAFIDVHGMPPKKFFHRKLLAAMHTLLTTGDPDVSIGQMALQLGVPQHEHGRFSGDFKEWFGVSPRETQRHRRR